MPTSFYLQITTKLFGSTFVLAEFPAWPQGVHYSVNRTGAYDFEGGTAVSPINAQQIQEATPQDLKAGIASKVESGTFSPTNSSQEEAAATVIQTVLQV